MFVTILYFNIFKKLQLIIHYFLFCCLSYLQEAALITSESVFVSLTLVSLSYVCYVGSGRSVVPLQNEIFPWFCYQAQLLK